MTGYLPPTRPQFPPPTAPPKKRHGHIIGYVIAGVCLIAFGWSWDRLHSFDALLMTHGQVVALQAVVALSFLGFIASLIVALCLTFTDNR